MLNINSLGKNYSEDKNAKYTVKNFNLQVKPNEFICLIGHSGCGKSTVLNMIAGLVSITAGEVLLDNKKVNGAGPERAMVFQSPHLFPWMTALDNVMLGVDRVYPSLKKSERKDLCLYYLDKVGLAESFGKKASELSMGMRQRVGIARALALRPKVLLLDEPFGMLDSMTRVTLQFMLMELLEQQKTTAIMVTHDVDEAILLADRIVMMTKGPEAKVGSILEIPFAKPRNGEHLQTLPEYYDVRGALLEFLDEDHSVHHDKPNDDKKSSAGTENLKEGTANTDRSPSAEYYSQAV